MKLMTLAALAALVSVASLTSSPGHAGRTVTLTGHDNNDSVTVPPPATRWLFGWPHTPVAAIRGTWSTIRGRTPRRLC